MMHILGKLCLLCLSAFALFACADFIASYDDSAPSYTLAYDGNGNTSGSVPAESFKYAKREYIIVKSNSGGLAKTGHTFMGWNTKNDGNGKTYLPGARFAMRNEDVTLYARWVSPGTALWARSVASGSGYTQFSGVAADSSGNVYAVGAQKGNAACTYGTVSAAGAYSGGYNVVIVKYDSSGTALWARSVASSSDESSFSGVAADASGNVFAVGTQMGTAACTYGTVSAAGAYSWINSVIVKYDSSGTALWARSVAAGSGGSNFTGVAADSSGNVYAVGAQFYNAAYTYGTVSVTGAAASAANSVIVKYDSSGTAQWARSVSAGSLGSNFYGVAADSSGNVYAVGVQQGNAAYTYGTVSATGASSNGNSVVVKYDSSGTALWAESVASGSSYSNFAGVVADSSWSVYAVGGQEGNSAYTYGTAKATGASSNGNSVVVKYAQ